MRVTTSFSSCSDENFFDVSFRFSLNCFSNSVVVIMGSAADGDYEVRVSRSFPMSFDKNLLVSSFGKFGIL